MKNEYTPGPWRWELNLKSKDLLLCGGKPTYDKTVMDFVRWGMGGACPRFSIHHGDDLQIMHRADEMAEIVPERKHHANWFQTINNADAMLIAAAPDLLEALKSLTDTVGSWLESGDIGMGPVDVDEYIAAVKAIEKATKP